MGGKNKLGNLEKVKGNKNGHGGARAGGGRKKKEIKFQELGFGEKRKCFNKFVTPEDFEEIVKNYIIAAKIDPARAEYVINQLIGKAPQAVHLSGVDGEPLFSQEDKAKTKAILENVFK